MKSKSSPEHDPVSVTTTFRTIGPFCCLLCPDSYLPSARVMHQWIKRKLRNTKEQDLEANIFVLRECVSFCMYKLISTIQNSFIIAGWVADW